VNSLDIVFVVVLAIATGIGVWKGIIRMALTLAGLILGIFLAGRFYVPFSERLTLISSPTGAKIAAFLIIFIGIMVLAALLARLLEKATSAVMLGWVNRLVGGIIGFLVGAFFLGAIIAVWVKYIGVSEAMKSSRVAPFLLYYFPRVLAILPGDFGSGLRSFFD
jgi:membrane protein required for colicin V production